MIVFLGLLVVVVGFGTRRNPLLVVGITGVVTGLLGNLSLTQVLATFGEGFASSRSVTAFAITLPVIGLLERHGLKEQAHVLIKELANFTAGRFLALYLLFRQLTSALGLSSICGPAQTVRPIVAPMAEAAAERQRGGPLSAKYRDKVRSYAASADTVGLFFGEDRILAVGSILLVTGLINSTYHTTLEPLQLSLWSIPIAVCAIVIQSMHLLKLDKELERTVPPVTGRKMATDASPLKQAPRDIK
ncbi:DUF969 domain-containing protein [Streptomyces asiaticus]|uniref:DUF969 domain-containing protein n=1 Tax=Streptomyces asiaticus TaxID=114695 RepID=UPI003F676E56